MTAPHPTPVPTHIDNGRADSLARFIRRRRFDGQPEFEHLLFASGNAAAAKDDAPVDYLFLSDRDPHQPEAVFDRLRWGGMVIVASRKKETIRDAVRVYQEWRREESDHAAWDIETPLASERVRFLNLPFFGRSVYFMTARKIMLVPPGKSSDRFTYHVRLEKNPHTRRFEVVKQIPTLQRVLARLREKFPDADEETLRRRARKFTEKIFPVFLTRETAMLRLLARDLPWQFRDRVPHVIDAEMDPQGYTRTLRMNWLRNSRPFPKGALYNEPLSQLEFARQAAELLTALHDTVGIMHLDLRLDNVVITERGVGFVDFGSAVRVGEEFPEASLLSSLFDEMMRTSQIQRMLGKMTEMGQVTSEEITSSHQRINKAVDFFYLALQINNPLANPDFRGLVRHDPHSVEAHELATLTSRILRPAAGDEERFTSARDILKGIEEIRGRLGAVEG